MGMFQHDINACGMAFFHGAKPVNYLYSSIGSCNMLKHVEFGCIFGKKNAIPFKWLS